ncbi:Xaa-Pro peptidase family protein [Thermomicrobium sp. 4228-Ro]|uniref:M24 family metallopeptidase n=1 Tax=Thermomicrobium sp. 4228-Ro TaxID=2993937 RepID=UPI0022498839|nr:Xaa-Pro peptidase family protein [Thermomicrobium sp. 4228-Ro]MCX2728426.1 Xaa-Pro peptidase family protein [Thermomicrobium sp. 4228-Ro]
MNIELAQRLARLRTTLDEHQIDVALIGPSADFRYLTCRRAGESERLIALIVPQAGDCTLLVPELEAPKFADCAFCQLHRWRDGDDPIDLLARTLLDLGAKTVGVNDEFRAGFLLPLQERLSGRRFTRVGPLLARLRITKSPAELALLREAIARVDAAWARFCAEGRLVGHTERQVARQLSDFLLEEGLEAVAFCIVASGPNAASPHHEPGDRIIQDGDPVVIDIGGPYQGYYADMTRTPVAGTLRDSDFAAAYEAVLEAQQAAFAAMRPGVACEEIDRIARDVLATHGLAEAFTHRLGHGLGLSVHEPPYLVGGNREPLRPGMVVTDEPGVYLPGRWGVRIEDVVVITEDGAERLTRSPHEFLELP